MIIENSRQGWHIAIVTLVLCASVFIGVALTMATKDPFYGFLLPLGLMFGYTFTDKSWADPARFWPCTPRFFTGCLLAVLTIFWGLFHLIG